MLIDFVSFQNFANSFSLSFEFNCKTQCVCVYVCIGMCKCASVCVCVLHFRQTDKAAALAYLLPCAEGLALRIRQRGTANKRQSEKEGERE